LAFHTQQCRPESVSPNFGRTQSFQWKNHNIAFAKVVSNYYANNAGILIDFKLGHYRTVRRLDAQPGGK
jgi:hypothetical protein